MIFSDRICIEMPPDRDFKESLPSDTEILQLFQTDSEKAWDVFIEKHADFIFTTLRRSGFDQDKASDCFIYICEKLCEKEFRRLKTIKYAGEKGDLMPWLKQVINHLSINWFWSVTGRKRLPKPIEELPAREQKIFKFYFWQGQTPSRVYESMRLEQERNLELADIFDALEKIFEKLSDNKIWNLMSGLLRIQQPLSFDKEDEETGLSIEPTDDKPLPEKVLAKKENSEILNQAMENLLAREKLVIKMRYEDTLAVADIAKMLNLEIREVKNLLKSSLYKLRKTLL